jgi:hypothetical protein
VNGQEDFIMRYLCIAAFVAPTLAMSDTIGEERALTINTINATDYEVIETQSMGAADFWCAAASYNELRQGRSDLIQLYVRTPRGPAKTAQGRKGVVFTTDPSGLSKLAPSLTLTVNQAGASLKSRKARSFCRDAFTRSTK